MSSFKVNASQFTSQVSTNMKQDWIAKLSSYDDAPFLADLSDCSLGFLQGGKRLRAKLAYAGWLSADGSQQNTSAIIDAATALEFYQASALVHDDLIDDSDTRRGYPTAHRYMSGLHTDSNRDGQAEEYGKATAVVLGDLLFSIASIAMQRACEKVGTRPGKEAREIFDNMTAEVAVGQYLDITASTIPLEQTNTSALDTALKVIKHKSASYSVVAPVCLGAALSGAPKDLIDALQPALQILGEAFQLRDDTLGLFADPAATGKPAGDDLREGKRTVLIALTWDMADESGRNLLRSSLGNPTLTQVQVEEVCALIRNCGAYSKHEDMISERINTGSRLIEKTHITPVGRELLLNLSQSLIHREN